MSVAAAAVFQVLHARGIAVIAVPFFEDLGPEIFVARAVAAVLYRIAGNQDVRVGIADETVCSFPTDHDITAAAAEELIVSSTSKEHTADATCVETVVARIAVEPDLIGHRSGDLNVVVAVAADDDDTTARPGDRRRHTVDDHLKRLGAGAGSDHDRVVGPARASGAAEGQGGHSVAS